MSSAPQIFLPPVTTLDLSYRMKRREVKRSAFRDQSRSARQQSNIERLSRLNHAMGLSDALAVKSFNMLLQQRYSHPPYGIVLRLVQYRPSSGTINCKIRIKSQYRRMVAYSLCSDHGPPITAFPTTNPTVKGNYSEAITISVYHIRYGVRFIQRGADECERAWKGVADESKAVPERQIF